MLDCGKFEVIEKELANSLKDAMQSVSEIRMDHAMREDPSAQTDFPTSH